MFLHQLEFCFASSPGSSSLASLGSLNWTIMHVMLSVPVPSDIVMSPFAMPQFIISSIIKEVSPFNFNFLLDKPSDFALFIFRGEFGLFFSSLFTSNILRCPNFVGEIMPLLGPFSLLFLTNFTAYSLVKQSHMPSQATIMKSCSGFNNTFFTSGNDET